MKKIFAPIALLALLFCWAFPSARAADAFFGTKPAVSTLHDTTNYLVLVMGDGTNSLIRKINPSDLRTIIGGTIPAALSNFVTAGISAGATNAKAYVASQSGDGTNLVLRGVNLASLTPDSALGLNANGDMTNAAGVTMQKLGWLSDITGPVGSALNERLLRFGGTGTNTSLWGITRLGGTNYATNMTILGNPGAVGTMVVSNYAQLFQLGTAFIQGSLSVERGSTVAFGILGSGSDVPIKVTQAYFTSDGNDVAEGTRYRLDDTHTNGVARLKSLFVSTNIFLDSGIGNNSTAQRGNPHRPYATFPAALAACVPGDTLIIGPGVYPGNQTFGLFDTWYPTNNLRIIGSGRGITILGSPLNIGDTDNQQMKVRSDFVLENLTYRGAVFLGSSGIWECTNATLINVEIQDEEDCLFMDQWRGNVLVDGCYFTSGFDNISDFDSRTVTGSPAKKITVANSILDTIKSGENYQNITAFQIIAKSDTTYEIYNSRLKAENGNTKSIALYNAGTNTSTIRLESVSLENSNTNGAADNKSIRSSNPNVTWHIGGGLNVTSNAQHVVISAGTIKYQSNFDITNDNANVTVTRTLGTDGIIRYGIASSGGGGSGTPIGADWQVQLYSNNLFQSSSKFTYNPSVETVILSVGGNTKPGILLDDSGSTFGLYAHPRGIQTTNGALNLQAGDSTNAWSIHSTTGSWLPNTHARQGIGAPGNYVQTNWSGTLMSSNVYAQGGTLGAGFYAVSDPLGLIVWTDIDADKGDITVTGNNTNYTIDNGVVTYAKIQNASTGGRFMVRANGAGAGSYTEGGLGTGLTWENTTNIAVSVALNTNFAGVVITNTLEQLWSWQGFATNQVLNWAGTNLVICQPSNLVATIGFANAPSAGSPARTMRLIVYNTNAQAGAGIAFNTAGVDYRGQDVAYILGTNTFQWDWNGTNYLFSQGQILTTGSGPSVLQTNAILSKVAITNATADRVAVFAPTTSQLTNDPVTITQLHLLANVSDGSILTNLVNSAINFPTTGIASNITAVAYNSSSVSGVGGANTNFTLLATQAETYVNGFTNVSIRAIMQYSPAKIFYPNVVITNGGGSDRTLEFSAVTNRYRFVGVYGTNAPSVLTNGTQLHLGFRCDGTNTTVAYGYFAWP